MLKPRILLADDHRIFLAGLQKLLSSDFDIVGTAEDGRALLAAAAKLVPDLIVVDVSMPMMNGIEAVKQLARVLPQTKMVFLSQHADPLFAAEAMRAGGAAYVLKRDAPDRLLGAIREALKPKLRRGNASGTHVRPGSRAKAMVEAADNPLTARQKEIFQLAAEGKSLKEIASILNVSVKTVEFHKYRLMRILGARTNSDLTAIAIRHGVITV
jgi:DNA-binding NarL/FixJ family response regulator